MGPLAKVIGSTMGYVSEANAARKASKSPQPPEKPAQQGALNDGNSHQELYEPDAGEHDEQDWQFDEVQTQEAPHDTQNAIEQAHGVDEVVQAFLHRHPPPPPYEENGRERLPCPVIIPQRRPGARTRGFVRAYAPDLEACGIDESVFMDFELGFERAIRLSPAFHAMQLVVVGVDKAVLLTAGFMPIMKLVSLAAHSSIEASRRTYMNVQ